MVDASTVQKVCLRGRDADLAAVAGPIAAAAAGRGSALVVTGPAGIGKTALLAGALSGYLGHAAPDGTGGVTVLAVTGCPAESALPFAGLHRLLASAPEHRRVVYPAGVH